MRIALVLGVIALFVGVHGLNCPSLFGGSDCSKIQCVNGGYTSADSVNVCICPPGYLGIHCEAVKTSLPPTNHYKAGKTSFNILNINLHTQYWGVKTYENIRNAIGNFTKTYAFDTYTYGYNTNAPYLDGTDQPVEDISFSTTVEKDSSQPLILGDSLDTGLYWCYQVEIYENLIDLIREGTLRNTAVTIITQHPPTSYQLEEAQQTAVAFGIRVNVLWISDQTFNRCDDADVAALKTFVELTGGLFVQLQSELDDAPTQNLVSQVLLTHYKPQFVSIQSFDSCDNGQSVQVVIDPVVNGPYNFVFLGDNAVPTSDSFRACLLQQPLRSFDGKLAVFSSPDPTCSSVTVKASGSCTVIVFTNGNPTSGPLDLAIYTTYVEDETIDSSRYGIIEGVPFLPAIHVEPPSSSSQVVVNSIDASFDNSWNPVLQKRSPAAYEWIPSKKITCDSTKTYSLFLNISVDYTIVQRAVRVACLQTPPPPTTTTLEPVETTVVTTAEATSTEVPSTTVVSTEVTTSQDDVSSSTAVPAQSCNQPGVPFSFLFAYSTELDAKTYGLVNPTIVQAVKNYPFNGSVLNDAYLDSTDSAIRNAATVNDFSLELNAKQPDPTKGLGETLGSNAVSILQNFISKTSALTTNPLENSVLLLLPGRLPTANSADLPSNNYIDFVNKNVKVFSVISLASLIAQGQMVGRTGSVFNKLAAISNGHFIVANETIGPDVNSDYNKVVAQVMQFGYGQDLLFSRNIGNGRLNTALGKLRIPQSSSGSVTITITVSLSVVDTNAPNPPNRLLLALRPAAGSTSGATVVNFLTDDSVTRYETSNFYITKITVAAGEERDLVLQYNGAVDENDLLIRMWADRSTYHTAKYVDLAIKDASPDDKEGAALRVTLDNDCYKDIATTAKILITDCNGDVSTKDDTDQLSGSNVTAENFKYFGFVPFFCDSPPATSSSCISGTEAKYDVQFNFEDFSVTRSFWCSKSTEAFDQKCTKQDVYGNYQCTGNSPFMRGPTGKVPDCSGHGRLSVDFSGGIGNETYSCQCDSGYQAPNCASAQCTSANQDPLATDNSYHTFTLVLGLDNSVSTFPVLQEDVSQFLTLTAIPSVWKYQLLTYCSDGSVTNLYSGGDVSQFNTVFNSANVACNSPATDGSIDLTKVYQTVVRGLGRNVRGMIAFYTESQNMLTVSLEDFIVASRVYRQELFVLTALYSDDPPPTLPSLNSTISQAAVSTGGFLVQSWVGNGEIVQIDKDFIPSILSGKTSLAYVSTQQTTGFNVAVNSADTVAWVVTWGIGSKFTNANSAIVSPSDCTTADDTMAMCKLTEATSYKFVAPSTSTTYTVAVFITNEPDISPSFQIVSDLSQDAANAVSTTSSDTRTIVSMFVPTGYQIVDNDGDGGLTRTIQRQSCTFGYTAYSVFADSKYAAGVNTAMITLQSTADASSPKFTRYFAFGTTDSASCQNGGSAVSSTGSCSCPTGFQGADCSFVNCSEASTANAWADVCVCDSLEDATCASHAPYCQFPPWPSTFLLAYSRQLPVDLYENVVQIVTDVLTNYPNQDNVLRDAFLDDKDDEVVRQPKDYQTFFSDISNNRPNPTPSQTLPSNAVTIIENFIPTAQETSEYSGKTTNWLENSILLLLPVYVSPEDDLTAENYTSFINRNVKVFIVLSTELLSAQGGSKDLSTFSRIAARTNGHLITVGSGDYGRVVSEVMRFGYGQDLLFTRNIGRAASGQRVTGSLRTPQSTSDLINVTITITEEIGSNAPGLPSMLYLQFESVGGSIKVDFLERDNAIHNSSNFYSATIPLLPELEYIITVAYQPFYNDTTDLLIRMWKDRETYQYAEFVDLDIYPTNPDDKEGAALRMTVINDCYQQSNADIWISDCTGLETQKFDVEQRTGLPIITESSFPKFAFVPYFCDAMPVGGSACVQGAEGKYDVQLTVGTYSITRSFECLAGSEPTKCTKQDGNGNYYCTRDTVPYKRGPTGQLTDCSPHGFSQFDAVDTQDYVCICDKGYSGVSCEKTG